jgi:hypothetical protein
LTRSKHRARKFVDRPKKVIATASARARKFFDKPRKVILTAIVRTLKFFDRSLGDIRAG